MLFSIIGIILYYNKPFSEKIISTDEAKLPQEMTDFFKHIKIKRAELVQELEKVKKQVPIDRRAIQELEKIVTTYTIGQYVADKDIDALKKMSPEAFAQRWQIIQERDEWANKQETQKLKGLGYLADNALGFIIFHSLTDSTPENKKKTLEILEIMLADKKVDPNATAGLILLVQEDVSKDSVTDFVGMTPIVMLAAQNSKLEMAELLLKYGAVFSDNDINSLNQHTKPIPNLKKILSLFDRYSTQKKDLESTPAKS